jgi:hypothetical protein
MTTEAVKVNLEDWGRTLQDYVQFSSKTMESALNGKLRDLMFRCKDKTPMGKTRPEVLSGIRNLRAVAVKRLKTRYGRFTREEVAIQMRRIGLGRGFMRSAFVKATNMIPRNEASAYGTVPMSAARFGRTSASVALATLNQLVANAECRWQTQGETDTTQKQAIADTALSSALGEAVADMRNYMREKLIRKAQQVSG